MSIAYRLCKYVDIKCSSTTDNQSLKLSTVYSSLFVDFHKLLGHLFRRHLVYLSFVYHTVLMQMQLIVLQKRAFLCPRAPPYNTPPLPPWFRRPCALHILKRFCPRVRSTNASANVTQNKFEMKLQHEVVKNNM